MNPLTNFNENSFVFLMDDFFQIFKECYCHFPEKLFDHFPNFGINNLQKDFFLKNSNAIINGLPKSDLREQFWAGKTLFANDITRYINTTICIIDDMPIKYENFRKFLILTFSVEKDSNGEFYSGINLNGNLLEYDFNLKQETLEKYFQLKNSSNKIDLLRFHKEIVYAILVNKDIKILLQIAKDIFTMKDKFEKIHVVCPFTLKEKAIVEEKVRKSSFNC